MSLPGGNVGSGVGNITGAVRGVGSGEAESGIGVGEVGVGVVGSGVGVDGGAGEIARGTRNARKQKSIACFIYLRSDCVYI